MVALLPPANQRDTEDDKHEKNKNVAEQELLGEKRREKRHL